LAASWLEPYGADSAQAPIIGAMHTLPTSLPARVLALDTSTDRLSLALGPAGGPAWASHEGAGGAQASAELIPRILELLAACDCSLAQLDAIAFGQGPGAFTGLRTTCAVVQGLAVAARPGGIPVLPVPTLLAVVEEARHTHPEATRLTVALDARMDELYVADAVWREGWVQLDGEPWLCRPESFSTRSGWPQSASSDGPPELRAGNAWTTCGARLHPAWQGVPAVEAWPRAQALLRLVPALWRAGLAVPAAQAQPLYVRNKVAQTTAEREQQRQAAAHP